MHSLHKHSKKGFTLIELLVVVAIIGVLSSVVLASLSDARAQARDAKREADMRQIQTALELYYNDKGHYPCENASLCSGQSTTANGRLGEGSHIDTLLGPYMGGTVSMDPRGPGDSTYFYYYDGAHCNNSDKLNGQVAVTISFNKAETSSDIRRDTTCGGEGNVDGADFNIIVGPSLGF